MFLILDRYIGKTIIKLIGITMFLLVSLSAIIRFIEQLRALKGSYDVTSAAIYSLLSIFKDMEAFFPIATLIGALIGLGQLASKNELVVMETSGFSRHKIILSTLKTAFPLSFLIILMTQYIMPPCENYVRNMRYEKSSGHTILQTKGNIWTKDDNTFIHISRLNSNTHISDLALYDVSNNELQRITVAKDAEYINNQWLLNQVEITDFTNKEQIRVDYIATKAWHSSITPSELSIVVIEPDALSISGIYQYAEYLKMTGQDSSRYLLLFWKKIFAPISIAIMVLLALSYIFGPLRSVSMGIRIVAGISTGFVFHIANNVFSQMAIVAGFPAFASALITPLLFSVFAFVLLKKNN